MEYYSNLYGNAFPESLPEGYSGQNHGEQLLTVQPDWPAAKSDPHVGQVGGIAIDAENHVHVYHRGDNDFT